LPTLSDYCDYLFSGEGMKEELHCMIDAVTTNKTDFFREPSHFEFLSKTAVPSLIKRGRGRAIALKCWSAGCSTGEEPYSLAMVLNDLAERHEDLRFSILATDISTKVLHAARLAIYRGDKARDIPIETKKKYLMKSRDRGEELVRITPRLRQQVEFRRLNLTEHYELDHRMDIIFCRNVLIYFDRQKQERILERLCGFLNAGGYLFVGHSETLNGMSLPLRQSAPAAYMKN
jgi:chemotaxis protein methyltransferase CheR